MSNSEESQWLLPSSWSWTTIGEVADVIGGGTPATKDPNNFTWVNPRLCRGTPRV